MESETSSELFNLANIINIEIHEELRQKLCFRESLIIGKFDNEVQETPDPTGGMCLDIQSAENNKKIVIYVSTKFKVDDATGGSKITTWVDSNLHTLEEKRVEFLSGAEIQKQSLYVGVQRNHMYIRHGLLEGGQVKLIYPFAIAHDLICEGANFVLMRLLAICLYIGQFEMTTLYINGDLCRNIYRCTGPESGDVNGVKMDICRIQRTIIEKCGIIHRCSTVLTLDGRLVQQDWHDCPYAIHLNPLQDPTAAVITEAACGCEQRVPLTATWQEDIELMSEFLDRRKLCEKRTNNYLADNKEVQDLVADYVKSLLEYKPEKVLEFTIDHFSRYSSTTK